MKKNPSAGILAEKIYIADGGQVPAGYETMTEAALAAWLAAQTPPTYTENPAIAAGKAQDATDVTDLAAVKALIPDIKAGTGTNAERIARLEKAVVRIFRAIK